MCRSCDLAVSITQIKKHYDCICPRCGRKLISNSLVRESDVAIVAFAALIFLFISIVEPFMSISVMGTGAAMSLTSIVSILNKQWGSLLYVFLFFTFFSPVSVLSIIVFIGGLKYKPNVLLAKFYSFNHSMCMVDVFVLGIVVSLIKLTALADVTFYVGFYTTFIFSVLMIWCCLKFNSSLLWEKIKNQSKLDLVAGKSAMSQFYKVCLECGYVFKAKDDIDICPRCKTQVSYRRKNCISKSLALLISALILYLPSNMYPVMYTEFLGSDTGSNIIEGVIEMWQMNSYFVSFVILLASIFIPAFKICSMLFILYATKFSKIVVHKRVSRLYRFVVFIGRWSLIDVYVVIIMSSIVKIGNLLDIEPGFAIICFCSVVIITVFSAETFDERLIWNKV
mgnify:CR=1 FL=1